MAEQLMSIPLVLWGFTWTSFSGAMDSMAISSCSQMHSWIMCFCFLSWEKHLFCISEPLHSVNPSAVKWGLSAASQGPSSFVLKSEYRLVPLLKTLFCRKSYAWYIKWSIKKQRLPLCKIKVPPIIYKILYLYMNVYNLNPHTHLK